VISSFAKKLALARELKIGAGRLEILRQRVIIVPVQLFESMIVRSQNDPEYARGLYLDLKKAVSEFALSLDRKYKVRGSKLADVLVKLTEMNGYGKAEVIKDDRKNRIAIFRVNDLPSVNLKGKVKGHADIYWSGVLAGGVSAVYGEDMDCVETKCQLNGSGFCEFLVAKKSLLKKKGMLVGPYKEILR